MDELAKDSNFNKGQWVRCMPHVVNLSVQQFLKEMKASSKEFREYQKITRNKDLIPCEEEDTVFLKVFLITNDLATMHCS